MKTVRWTTLAAALMAGAVAVGGGAAGADPTNAKSALQVPLRCPGRNVTVVVNGNGEFTPGHVVGSTAMFIPTAFNLTFSGPGVTEHDTAAKKNPPTNVVTCTINASLGGGFSINGTVTGFFTPRRR